MLIKRSAIFLFLFCVSLAIAKTPQYTVIDATYYKQIVLDSRFQVEKILAGLKAYRQKPIDVQTGFIVDQLMNTPYQYSFAMGEGDWQPNRDTYQPHAVHMMQDPVYRLDRFDCQTFVQTLIALLKANNLREFDHTYLQLAYGAIGNPQGEVVRYSNRNHFVDADFNPVNEANGYLADVTVKNFLANYAKKIQVEVDRQAFFLHQQPSAADNVRVLDAKDGPSMYQRFKHITDHLPLASLKKKQLTITYLPKEVLVLIKNGMYVPNQFLLANILTPSVMEIVRDVKHWKQEGMSIAELIGTDTSISHVGILYRRRFSFDELIYNKITCAAGQPRKVCYVTPVYCKHKYCDELMFANATDLYPQGYVWYQRNLVNAHSLRTGQFFCSRELPRSAKFLTYCNRVEQLPLFDYLTNFQYGDYAPMTDPSILGIHLEQIL